MSSFTFLFYFFRKSSLQSAKLILLPTRIWNSQVDKLWTGSPLRCLLVWFPDIPQGCPESFAVSFVWGFFLVRQVATVSEPGSSKMTWRLTLSDFWPQQLALAGLWQFVPTWIKRHEHGLLITDGWDLVEKDLHSNYRVRELGQSLPAPTPDVHTPHTLHTHTTHLTHEHTALIVVPLFTTHAHRPPTCYTHDCIPCVYTYTLTICYIHPPQHTYTQTTHTHWHFNNDTTEALCF